jgi:hypothetical protein
LTAILPLADSALDETAQRTLQPATARLNSEATMATGEIAEIMPAGNS